MFLLHVHFLVSRRFSDMADVHNTANLSRIENGVPIRVIKHIEKSRLAKSP